MEYLGTVVKRYRESPALLYWQVENEPYFPFGECPENAPEMIDYEIAAVRSADKNHGIVITDSGEFGLWVKAAKRGDAFGITMYRRSYHELFGQMEYKFPPWFYALKERLVRLILKEAEKPYLVVELAAEPWLERQLYESPVDDQLKVFDENYFRNTVKYAREAGFSEYYLWGAEWWYWMKEKQGHPEFWEFARTLF